MSSPAQYFPSYFFISPFFSISSASPISLSPSHTLPLFTRSLVGSLQDKRLPSFVCLSVSFLSSAFCYPLSSWLGKRSSASSFYPSFIASNYARSNLGHCGKEDTFYTRMYQTRLLRVKMCRCCFLRNFQITKDFLSSHSPCFSIFL